MKVLHIVAPAFFGGVESVVCTLVPAIARPGSGINIRIAILLTPQQTEGHPVVAKLRESNIFVDVVSVSARRYFAERRRIAELCLQWKPDLVHTHGYRADLVHSAVTRQLSIPHVSTLHGFTGGSLRNRGYEFLQRKVARRMHAVIAVSRPLGERLQLAGISRDRLHVVPNAYRPRADYLDRENARRILGLPLDAVVIGWAGRLTGEKGADVLLDALGELRPETILASFLGDGAERAHLAARAQSRLPGRVRWHGLISDSARLLRAFDVFVLSSRTEGTPVVLFEAMDAGVPIVATRVGGVPDVLREEEGVLVSPNDPAHLALGIRQCLADRSGSQVRAISARSRLIEDYGVDQWVKRHTSIYQHVLKQRAGSR